MLTRLRRHTPDLTARVLARFSRLALVALVLVVATGTLRALAELDAPRQLWETGYGRTILLKVALLCPLVALAARNRRAATARLVGAELALALAIVLVASLLVAEVPGRS